MNFACRTDKSVCTTKQIVTSKKLSKETINRRNYIRSHEFKIDMQPSGEYHINVTKRQWWDIKVD